MNRELLLFLIGAAGFFLCWTASLIVFGVCGPRYLRLHAAKLHRPFPSPIYKLGWLYLEDYRRCLRVVRESGRKPRWLWVVDGLHVLSVVFLLVPLGWLVWNAVRELIAR